MDGRIDVSVVIPAYNEENRICSFLQRLADYCGQSSLTYEIIIVDDFSSDKTVEVSQAYAHRFSHFCIIRSKVNSGKGYSVKKGMFAAMGDYCLFMDADGSVEPEEIERNLEFVQNGSCDIFIGSRVLRDSRQVLITRKYRELMGKVFNFFVKLVLFKDIRDTQCGFKIFRRDVIRPVLSRVQIEGFGFDMELLYIAKKLSFIVREGPVSWHHVDGAKVHLMRDSMKMFINILQVRSRHRFLRSGTAGEFEDHEYSSMFEVESLHWWFASKRVLLEEVIRTLCMEKPDILDAGCGTGGNMVVLNHFGRTFGLDSSARALKFCRKNGLIDLIAGGIENIPLKVGSFDIITCLDVLEHIENPPDALSEIRRTLSDDGIVIVTVPAFPSLWRKHDAALGHLRRYRRRTLKRVLEESGFQILKMNYLYSLSFFFMAPLRLFRRIFTPSSRIESDTTGIPPKPLNSLLKSIFSAEARFSVKHGLPLGSTIYAVVRKNPLTSL